MDEALDIVSFLLQLPLNDGYIRSTSADVFRARQDCQNDRLYCHAFVSGSEGEGWPETWHICPTTELSTNNFASV